MIDVQVLDLVASSSSMTVSALSDILGRTCGFKVDGLGFRVPTRPEVKFKV